MTTDQLLHIVQFAIMLAAGAFIASWGRERQSAQRLLDQREKEVDRRFTEIFGRVDHAGQKMSDLTNTVQGLPDRLRDQFLSESRRELQSVAEELRARVGRLENAQP